MKNDWLFGAVRHVILMAVALFFLTPFVWMVLTSMKPESEILSSEITLFPKRFAMWENYRIALTETPLLRYMLNGLVITVGIFVLQVLVAVPAAYALSKINFKGRGVFFMAVLGCLLIPTQAVAIPWYLLMFKLGLLNTYASLIAPFTISVFGIFLLRQFFNGVPNDLIAAARMDGYSEMGIVWKIMVPTAIPALMSFGIFSVVAHWNDYFWPLIVLNDQALYTPPLGVVEFRSDEAGDKYGPLMAAATIIISPLIATYLLAQRRFIEGITMSGMK